MRREIEAPDREFLTEDEGREWLRAQGVQLSGNLFGEMLESGYVKGMRTPVRGPRMIHWKGLVMVFWMFELGDLPRDLPERTEISGREVSRKPAKGE